MDFKTDIERAKKHWKEVQKAAETEQSRRKGKKDKTKKMGKEEGRKQAVIAELVTSLIKYLYRKAKDK